MKKGILIWTVRHNGAVETAFYGSFEDAVYDRVTAANLTYWQHTADDLRPLCTGPDGAFDGEIFAEEIGKYGVAPDFKGRLLAYSFADNGEEFYAAEGASDWLSEAEHLAAVVGSDCRASGIETPLPDETAREFAARIARPDLGLTEGRILSELPPLEWEGV